MVTIRIGGDDKDRFVALRVGGTNKLLVQYADYIISEEMADLLAVPTPYPTAEDCTEIRYSISREGGADLLSEDSPSPEFLTEDDESRIRACQANFKMRASRKRSPLAERAAVRTFRMPDFKAERELYRECTDPATGARTLVILWGVAKAGEKGRVAPDMARPVMAHEPQEARVRTGARRGPAPAPPPQEPESVSVLPPDKLDEDLVADEMRPESEGWDSDELSDQAARAAAGKCKCWVVGLLSLLVMAALAGLGYWWVEKKFDALPKGHFDLADAQKDIKSLNAKVATLESQLADASKKANANTDTVTTLAGKVERAAEHRGELKEADDAVRENVAALKAALADFRNDLQAEFKDHIKWMMKNAGAIDIIREDIKAIRQDVDGHHQPEPEGGD